MKSPHASRIYLFIAATLSAFLIGSSSLAAGQTETDEPSKWDNLERNIELLVLHIENEEKRLEDLHSEAKSLDNRIESTIDKIVGLLKSQKDSRDSGQKVARMKLEAIEGLKRNMEYFAQQREFIKKERSSEHPDISVEDLTKGVEAYTDRIEKRADQVIEIQRSLGSYREVEKYNRYVLDDGVVKEKSEAYDQNRRQNYYADKGRDQIIAELKEAIERLRLENRSIDSKLRQPGQSDEVKAALNQTREENNRLIEKREAQLLEIMEPGSGGSNSKAITRTAAHSLDDLIHSLGSDLREDFEHLKRLILQYHKGQMELKELQDRLAEWEKLREGRPD